MIKKLLKKIISWKKQNQFIDNIKKYNQYRTDFKRFSQLQSKERFRLDWNDRYPCLDDKTDTSSFDAHYIYHPAWAARLIAKIHPVLHVDISSSLVFCTMLSAYVPVEFYDFRPAELTLEGLTCKRGDLMNLPFPDNSVESLSCMHVIEHIGLGRYGDPLDPEGDLKAIAELKRVLIKGGSLFFVVPVGQPRIQYNAHRIYSYEQIASNFPDFQIEQFALVDDRGKFMVNATASDATQQRYGCGCWHFVKC